MANDKPSTSATCDNHAPDTLRSMTDRRVRITAPTDTHTCRRCGAPASFVIVELKPPQIMWQGLLPTCVGVGDHLTGKS